MEKDLSRAVELYQAAAEQGDRVAACNLGYLYETGTGVRQNWEQAVAWYRRSVERGYARAQYRLAQCYEHGRGVQKDSAQALELYDAAAKQSYEDAAACAARLRAAHCAGGTRGILERFIRRSFPSSKKMKNFEKTY